MTRHTWRHIWHRYVFTGKCRWWRLRYGIQAWYEYFRDFRWRPATVLFRIAWRVLRGKMGIITMKKVHSQQLGYTYVSITLSKLPASSERTYTDLYEKLDENFFN